ncbi:hypothetical protein CKO23_19845 [Thiocystis violacea]|nr:hypothetical protein [Thiocystis violacea]
MALDGDIDANGFSESLASDSVANKEPPRSGGRGLGGTLPRLWMTGDGAASRGKMDSPASLSIYDA